jgi:hypothetical protein
VRVKTIEDRERCLGLAGTRLRSALELLDRAEAPPHIAAQIDLALHQLEQLLDAPVAGTMGLQIERKADPQ